MEEKIESKIAAIVERILNKPDEEITMDDYMILSSELKDIRFRRENKESNERLAKMVASTFSHSPE